MILDRFRLDGQAAVVTGAGRGLGAAIAVAFAEVGADVLIASRTRSELEAVAAQVEALRARIEALGVEIEALREDAPASAPVGTGSTAPVPARPVPPAGHEVEAGERGGGVGDLSDDPVSARLVVSKMHLDGMGREEIIDRLVAGYRLEDPEVLVDEVIEGLS